MPVPIAHKRVVHFVHARINIALVCPEDKLSNENTEKTKRFIYEHRTFAHVWMLDVINILNEISRSRYVVKAEYIL